MLGEILLRDTYSCTSFIGLREGAWQGLKVFIGDILLRGTLVPVLLTCVKVRGKVSRFGLERYT